MRPLRRQARRPRLLRAVDGLGLVLSVLLGSLAIQLVIDWSFRLRLDMRAALLAAVVSVALWTSWRCLVSPLRVPFGAREMASAVERGSPNLDAVLISAVRFAEGRVGPEASNSPELVASVIERATRNVTSVALDKVINMARARKAVLRILVLLAAPIALLLVAPQTMGIWLERNLLLRDVDWPQRTEIVVDLPGDGILRGAFGDDLEVRAYVADGYEVPRQMEIVYVTRAGKTGRETMTGVGQRGFRVTFPRVREDFRFYLTGGDDTTEWFDTELSERPAIETATLTIAAPAYTGLGPLTLPDGQRAAEMYPGSTLTISAVCSKPLAEARLLSGTETIAELQPQGSSLTVSTLPAESQTYHFDLVDRDGLRNAGPVRFSVRMLKDQPPTVRLKLPDVGNMVTPRAVLPIDVEYTDQLGLAEAVLIYQVIGATTATGTIAIEGFEPQEKRFAVRLEWPIAVTGAKVGDQVSVFARASDFDDINGPNVGESTSVAFRVVTDEELLAEFNRREQEYRRQFEQLVDSQERLRSSLLTVLGRMDDRSFGDKLDLQFAPLERQQRQITSRVNILRQQFEQVIKEMSINRLDTLEVRERVGSGIIDPLTELGRRDLADAADELRQLARESDAGTARTIDSRQVRIVVRMRQVLDNMLKWEGFQEAVTMLREILRLQREINVETREEIKRRGREVFED